MSQCWLRSAFKDRVVVCLRFKASFPLNGASNMSSETPMLSLPSSCVHQDSLIGNAICYTNPKFGRSQVLGRSVTH